jgi:hypothetical protein
MQSTDPSPWDVGPLGSSVSTIRARIKDRRASNARS